jgi:hypothetical protein
VTDDPVAGEALQNFQVPDWMTQTNALKEFLLGQIGVDYSTLDDAQKLAGFNRMLSLLTTSHLRPSWLLARCMHASAH